jgi:hypothetical protein
MIFFAKLKKLVMDVNKYLDNISVDNIMDLGDFFKNALGAQVTYFEESGAKNAALSASVLSSKFFLVNTSQSYIVILVYLSGASSLYETDRFGAFLHGASKDGGVSKSLNHLKDIDSLDELLDLLRSDDLRVEFPETIQGDLISLEEKEKRFLAWKEVFEKLIPYGVVVKDCKTDIRLADYGLFFVLYFPERPVPVDIAMKNEIDWDYFGNGSYVNFVAGDDWNARHQEVLDELKSIYNIPEVTEVEEIPKRNS